MAEIKILGAGLSGLTAAINLAKAGKNVRVFEKRKAVGEQIFPNFQSLKMEKNTPLQDYFAGLGLEPRNFGHIELSKAHFLTRTRSIHLTCKRKGSCVLRGGGNSLEYALFLQAKKFDMKFEFGSKIAERDARIVACGPRKVSGAAFGAIYKKNGLGDKEFLAMFDDRYSPKGLYVYALPTFDGGMEIVNCAIQPHVSSVKRLLFRALKERRELRELVDGQKPTRTFGGFAYVNMPHSAVRDGRLYIGEAAGFQDPFAGFGMNYALLSGKLAADSIINSLDYNELWKKGLMPKLKLDYARRFVMSIFGDRFMEFAMRKYADGDLVDFEDLAPSKGLAYRVLVNSLCRMELLKKRLTGYW